MPVGEKPSGRSFTGFYVSAKGGERYLLLFREVTGEDTGVFKLPETCEGAEILASNADVEVEFVNKAITARFSKPRSYVFIKLD